MAWSSEISDVAIRMFTVFAPNVALVPSTASIGLSNVAYMNMRVAPLERPLRMSDQPVTTPASLSIVYANGSSLPTLRKPQGPGVAGEREAEQRRVVGRRDLRLELALEGDAVVVRLGHLVGVAERERRSAPGAEGTTWKVCRSPIHGLGSWLAANASISGRLSALLSRW